MSGLDSPPTSHSQASPLRALNRQITACRLCPRLISYLASVCSKKPPRYRDWQYWGKPLTGFGDASARLLIVGLAPAAHGGNRTGRMFTGDRSGEWLYGALYRHGFASQADSVSREDGLLLRDCYITAALRCAPPNNRPTPGELSRCEPYLARELGLLPRVSVIVALGQIAFRTALKVLRSIRVAMPSPTPKFGHGLAYRIGGFMLLGSYHPSQQNTFTGKLTQPMFDRIFEMTKEFLSAKPPQSPA